MAIIEDDRLIREGLSTLINGAEGYRVPVPSLHGRGAPGIVEPDSGGDTRRYRVTWDVGMQGLAILHAKYPSTALLMLTVYEDDQRIFEALCAGASGYLLKKTSPDRLLACLAEVLEGGAPMSPEIARRVLNLFREIHKPDPLVATLTPHERRLLKLLVEGHNYQSAAGELGVSFSTINFHMQNIYGKLQVHSKAEAVSKALRQKLVR